MTLSSALPATHILVPSGAEYRAVKRGLAGVPTDLETIAIPMGMTAIGKILRQGSLLQNLKDRDARVLLLGLGGGLASNLQIGDCVLYRECSDLSGQTSQACDPILTQWLQDQLPPAKTVRGLTCDRVIYQAKEKAELYAKTRLDVVDMEGLAVLSHLNAAQIPTAILRVISDHASQSLPDLAPAIAPGGQLRFLPLVLQFARNPVAAGRLIRGSLSALGQLQAIARYLARLSAGGVSKDENSVKIGAA